KPEPVSNHKPTAPPAPAIPEPRYESPMTAEGPPAYADELTQTEERTDEIEVEVEVEAAPSAPAQTQPMIVINGAPPPPRVIFPKRKAVQFKEPKPVEEKKVHAKQEVLQFEPVTRGRFEKSEPTIVEGQDLDIPTFLRKN